MLKKIIVQIPCLNEEKTLPLVLKSIPKTIPGGVIETLIIDDGSTDKTIEVAKKHGVDHFVFHKQNMGLARSFHDGVNKALELGADILVNTDGDNQYPSEKISELVQPILNGEADIVIGDRQTQTIKHFSLFKRLMQRFGSRAVNIAAGTNVPDAASGFRAYSRSSLLRLNIVTTFSYCMETIIQAGNKHIPITSIKVNVNPVLRESRLFKNIWQHMFKSMSAIIRSFIMYRPYVLFITTAAVLGLAGLIPFLRYMYFYVNNSGGNHLQSLFLGGTLLTAAFLSLALGVIADLIRINRTLIEVQLEHLKEQQYKK